MASNSKKTKTRRARRDLKKAVRKHKKLQKRAIALNTIKALSGEASSG